jgi:hypothetical protein
MTTAYELALKALRPHLRTSRTLFEKDGGGLADATTAIANMDGTLDMIPLDILSDSVNLKRMWSNAVAPVAILFRELMDDWYGLFPASIDFTTWYIIAMPGCDHDIYRATTLAERSIELDFNMPSATVQLARVVNSRIIPVASVSSSASLHRAPAAEHEPANMEAPSD